MKVFWKKLKKCNKAELIFYFGTLIAYLFGYIFFAKSLLSLEGIETAVRIVVLILFGIWGLFYFLQGLLKMFERKHKKFILFTIISLIFIPIFFASSSIIDHLYHKIDGFSKDYITYTTNLVTKKDTTWDESKKLGMINDQNDIEGYILGKELLEIEKLHNEITEYDDYLLMLTDLKEQKIDGIIISSNYTVSYKDEGIFENIKEDTKVIYEHSKRMKNQDKTTAIDKKLTEPFTVLLLGVDSELDGLDKNQAFNGDTMIMVTFNPNTLNATMFSVPRDIYVPIACRNGAMAKINSSAARGVQCVIDTIKEVTDIDVDYYVKVNFKAVVDLVEALGGVEVDVQKPDYNTFGGRVCEQNSHRQWDKDNIVCMDPGLQTLNGEQALAYSRCRHLYTFSDIDRTKHQQQVVEGMAKKIKNIRSFSDFEKILNAIERNMDTNMDANKILSLYNVAKDIVIHSLNNSDETITIQKAYLEYYDLPVYLPSGAVSSALGYYKSSMEDISKMMKENLEIIPIEPVKTFSFSYTENYERKIAGKGLRDNDSKLDTIPNFIGKTPADVNSWANPKSIHVIIKTVAPGEEYYNSNYTTGQITHQSLPANSFLQSAKEITIYVNGSTE